MVLPWDRAYREWQREIADLTLYLERKGRPDEVISDRINLLRDMIAAADERELERRVS